MPIALALIVSLLAHPLVSAPPSGPHAAKPPRLEVRTGLAVAGEGRLVQSKRGNPVASRAGTLVAVPTSAGPRWVRLGRRLRTLGPQVFSVSNHNDRFRLSLEVSEPSSRQHGSPPWPYLILADGVRAATSTGTGAHPGVTTATFDLSRDRALALSRAQALPLNERVPLGEALQGTWRLVGPVQPGQPIAAVLRLENHGDEAVRIMNGGRQRGVRDNRFSFEARLGGELLPVKHAADFGGLAGLPEIPPGGALEVTAADLREWVSFDAPGVYTVSCRYEGELFPPGDGTPNWADEPHRTWDYVAAGTLSILNP